MQLPLKTRSNSAFRLIYHLVLVTKFRFIGVLNLSFGQVVMRLLLLAHKLP